MAAGVKDGDKVYQIGIGLINFLQGVSFKSGQIQGKLLNKDWQLFIKKQNLN